MNMSASNEWKLAELWNKENEENKENQGCISQGNKFSIAVSENSLADTLPIFNKGWKGKKKLRSGTEKRTYG